MRMGINGRVSYSIILARRQGLVLVMERAVKGSGVR